MDNHHESAPTSFAWNAGGWLGGQFGCTLWLLILGLVLLGKDPVSAVVCLASFGVLNLWGLFLWRRRERLRAYAGLQWFLLAASVIIAVVTWVMHTRGVAEQPTRGALVSTYLPYWVIGAAPALMLLFFLMERMSRRGRG